MGTVFCHGLGVLACSLVLCSFAMTSMRWLRLMAIASNVSFIGYAWTMQLWPILVLHGILLPLNTIRLAQMPAVRPKAAVPGCWAAPATPARHVALGAGR